MSVFLLGVAANRRPVGAAGRRRQFRADRRRNHPRSCPLLSPPGFFIHSLLLWSSSMLYKYIYTHNTHTHIDMCVIPLCFFYIRSSQYIFSSFSPFRFIPFSSNCKLVHSIHHAFMYVMHFYAVLFTHTCVQEDAYLLLNSVYSSADDLWVRALDPTDDTACSQLGGARPGRELALGSARPRDINSCWYLLGCCAWLYTHARVYILFKYYRHVG